MGKRKVISEEGMGNVHLPAGNDVMGIAVKLLGFVKMGMSVSAEYEES